MEGVSYTTHYSYKIFIKGVHLDNSVHSIGIPRQHGLWAALLRSQDFIHKIVTTPQQSNCWDHGNCRPKNRKTDKEGGGGGGGAGLLQGPLNSSIHSLQDNTGQTDQEGDYTDKRQHSETYATAVWTRWSIPSHLEEQIYIQKYIISPDALKISVCKSCVTHKHQVKCDFSLLLE